MLLLATDEELASAGATLNGSGGIDSIDDQANLTLAVLVLDILVTKICNNLGCGLLMSVLEEPTGGLGEDPNTPSKHNGEDNLKGNRELGENEGVRPSSLPLR